jgi:hypothetical protein
LELEESKEKEVDKKLGGLIVGNGSSLLASFCHRRHAALKKIEAQNLNMLM